jgi:hypothetical protein
MLVQQGAKLYAGIPHSSKRVLMSKSPRFIIMALLIFCNVYLLYPQPKPQPPVVEDFHLEGTALFHCHAPLRLAPARKMVHRIMARVKALTLFTFALAATANCTSTGSTLSRLATSLTPMRPDSMPPSISTRRPIPPSAMHLPQFCNS